MPRTYTQYGYFESVIISPVIPEDLRLDQIGNAVRLSWLDKSNYEDGFVIERKKGTGSWKKVYFVDQEKDFFVDFGPFVNGEIYYYRVSSYIVLSNQNYLVSSASAEASLTMVMSSASVGEQSIVEVEFGATASISLEAHEKIRVYVKDASSIVDYLWFSDSESFTLSGHDDYADVFALKIGSGTIRAKKADNTGEAILNITVTRDEIEDNPSQVSNLRARSTSSSSIEVLWNYDDGADISHFEIYRLKRTGASSKNSLINFSDLTENRVGVVPFDSSESIYNFYDYGLKAGSTYIYAIAAFSKYNKISLYIGDEEYDYVGNRKYVYVGTESSDIEIDPAIAYVSPGSSLYLGILNPSGKSLSTIEWTIEENNSGSSLRTSDEDVTYFEASDRSISKDGVKVQADSDSAKARIIVTETI